MNRTRVVSLVVAAVVGVGGGVLGAMEIGGGEAGGAPDAVTEDPPATPPEAPDATPDEPLLFHAAQRIFDGEEVIDVEPSGPGAQRLRGAAIPSAVVRSGDGYLLSFPPTSLGLGEPVTREDLWRVEADGSARRIAVVAPGWDLNLDRSRVVAYDVTEELLTVWDAVSGEPVTRWDGTFGPRDSAAYAGAEDQVLISTRTDPRAYELRRWDVAAASTSVERLPGYDRMAVSPEGSWVAGIVGPDGAASEDQDFCLQLHETYLAPTEAFWQTCDWRPERLGRPEFSPDGTRQIVVPAAGGETNPAEYAVIDSESGPDPLVARLPAPNGTVSATWADDDSIYLTGIAYTEADADFWVRRCPVGGGTEADCVELPTETPGEVVVGEVR